VTESHKILSHFVTLLSHAHETGVYDTQLTFIQFYLTFSRFMLIFTAMLHLYKYLREKLGRELTEEEMEEVREAVRQDIQENSERIHEAFMEKKTKSDGS
jgi:hypothetical protein